jgi:hypothetical protein
MVSEAINRFIVSFEIYICSIYIGSFASFNVLYFFLCSKRTMHAIIHQLSVRNDFFRPVTAGNAKGGTNRNEAYHRQFKKELHLGHGLMGVTHTKTRIKFFILRVFAKDKRFFF